MKKVSLITLVLVPLFTLFISRVYCSIDWGNSDDQTYNNFWPYLQITVVNPLGCLYSECDPKLIIPQDNNGVRNINSPYIATSDCNGMYLYSCSSPLPPSQFNQIILNTNSDQPDHVSSAVDDGNNIYFNTQTYYYNRWGFFQHTTYYNNVIYQVNKQTNEVTEMLASDYQIQAYPKIMLCGKSLINFYNDGDNNLCYNIFDTENNNNLYCPAAQVSDSISRQPFPIILSDKGIFAISWNYRYYNCFFMGEDTTDASVNILFGKFYPPPSTLNLPSFAFLPPPPGFTFSKSQIYKPTDDNGLVISVVGGISCAISSTPDDSGNYTGIMGFKQNNDNQLGSYIIFTCNPTEQTFKTSYNNIPCSDTNISNVKVLMTKNTMLNGYYGAVFFYMDSNNCMHSLTATIRQDQKGDYFCDFGPTPTPQSIWTSTDEAYDALRYGGAKLDVDPIPQSFVANSYDVALSDDGTKVLFLGSSSFSSNSFGGSNYYCMFYGNVTYPNSSELTPEN